MMADASSLYNDDHGAEEDEVATDIGGSKREDFATGSLSIRRDNAAMMMDEPSPLLACCPLLDGDHCSSRMTELAKSGGGIRC